MIKVILILLYAIVWAASEEEVQTVQKCCYKGEQLDNDFKRCVKIDGSDVNKMRKEIFGNASNTGALYWLPEQLIEASVEVNYGILHVLPYDKINVYSLEGREFLVHEYEKSKYFIRRDLICFDTIANHSSPHVIATIMEILDIHKCCNKFEQLNAHANACVPYSDKQQVLQQEVINFIPSPYEELWHISGQLRFKLNYNILHKGYNFNRIFKYQSVSDLYIGDGFYRNSTAYFTGLDEDGNTIKGTTDAFCFDTIAEGHYAPRVMLAAVYDIYKCCPKGEYFNLAAYKCLARPGVIAGEVKNEISYWKENDETTAWIPKSFHTSGISVKYNTLSDIPNNFESGSEGIVVYIEEFWKLSNDTNGFPSLKANIPFLTGKFFQLQTKYFCFETLENNQQIIFLQNFPKLNTAKKCCFPGMALSADGYCKKHNGSDWAPSMADITTIEYLDLTPNVSISLPLHASCPISRFHVVSTWSSILADETFKVEAKTRDAVTWTEYCSDFEISSGKNEQVLAYCNILPLGDTFKAVRPLGVVSAALFLASAVVAVVRNDTRSSAHGRSLVAHALCLAAANVVQVSWFFNIKDSQPHCPQYSYPTYFFMIAANWWMTAITINMMKNFRQPLGALARVSSSSAKSSWRRFGIMSVFAWGGSIVLTTLVVTMHQYRWTLNDLGYVIPSFFETRTCGAEFSDFIRNQAGGETTFTNRLGALFYYYMPVAILVAVNITCIVLTVRRMREIGKDRNFVHGSESAKSNKEIFKNVSLYVKLMLTTGIMELMFEAVAWSVTQYLIAHKGDQEVYTFRLNNYIFGIYSGFLDLFRSICMLWLCMGPWCNVNAGWELCAKSIAFVWQKIMQWMGMVWKWMKRLCKLKHNQTSDVPLTDVSLENDKTS